jgi:hypothetical protein
LGCGSGDLGRRRMRWGLRGIGSCQNMGTVLFQSSRYMYRKFARDIALRSPPRLPNGDFGPADAMRDHIIICAARSRECCSPPRKGQQVEPTRKRAWSICSTTAKGNIQHLSAVVHSVRVETFGPTIVCGKNPLEEMSWGIVHTGRPARPRTE